MPEVSRALRRSAVLCRAQLLENAKLLRKIESTATSVLDIHDDLELAVAAGQSALARDLVATVKGWVGGLRQAVAVVQNGNAEQTRADRAATNLERTAPACQRQEDSANAAEMNRRGREARGSFSQAPSPRGHLRGRGRVSRGRRRRAAGRRLPRGRHGRARRRDGAAAVRVVDVAADARVVRHGRRRGGPRLVL